MHNTTLFIAIVFHISLQTIAFCEENIIVLFTKFSEKETRENCHSAEPEALLLILKQQERIFYHPSLL